MIGLLRQLLAAILSFAIVVPASGYDAAGNLQTRTDFNGKTTTYTYNVMNQLLSKIPDPSLNAVPVTYTYETSGANIGMRLSMSDASGTTNYTNSGTRLLRRSTPVGAVSYSYDPPGNVLTVSSGTPTSTIGGTSITYTYDKLNRLSTVATAYSGQLSGAPANGSTTIYGYDNVGNLQSVTYPNGVVHNYSYDTRNRLTNLGVNGTVSGAPGAIAGYTYTLDAAGHRTSVTELSGRAVGYTYDTLYRLTSETIASDPHAINGAVNYTYDSVGNRKQMTSSLAPVPAGLFNYDANDRFTAGDTYDNNGNTISSGGVANVYDFENHLIQKDGVSLKYDGDGNRIFKTVAGVTTGYLLDDRSPTGYVQVLDEVQGPFISRSYVYGLELIEQDRINTSTFHQTTSYNVYDGHGSVRALTDLSGAVTDTYDYDSFGNLVHSTGTTPNNYLFAGEQFDPDLNLYYNRARYLNVSTGRFWTMDPTEGTQQLPESLHRYLYANADPIQGTDPSGEVTVVEEEEATQASVPIQTATVQTAQVGRSAINLARFAAAVLSAAALAAEGDNSPPRTSNPEDRDEIIKLYRDADGTNPGAFSFTGGSCPFITSEVSLLEVPLRNKRFAIGFTALYRPPKTTCATAGVIIDSDLIDLRLAVVYSPTLTAGHWSLTTKSYLPTSEEQESIKKRLAAHAKDPGNQQ